MTMNDDLNEDWIKVARWDLPMNMDDLLAAMGFAADSPIADIQDRLKALMTHPSWEAAPTEIKQDALKIMTEGRPAPT